MSIKHNIKMWYYHRVKHYDNAMIRKIQLIKNGAKVGEKTYIFSDDVETAEPYLIEIGDNVIISDKVLFSTHDASACYYLDNASDIFGRIKIGNNCFIGMGAIVLPGVSIADNCIVGGGAVVTHSFDIPGSVIAGNPARVIATVEDLKKKNASYALNTWGMTFSEKKSYLLKNEIHFKGFNK